MTEENNVIDHKVENTNRVVGLSEEKFIKVFEYIKLGAYQADLARVGESSEAEKALELTNKALKLDPSNNEALLLKAVILNYLLARHKEAIDIFNKIATSEYRVWSDIGHAYEALEKYKEAINCYNKVPSSDKSYIAARYVIGTAYYKLEDYKNAIKFFDEAIKLSEETNTPIPDGFYNPVAYLIYYNDLAKGKKIIKVLDEILNTNPQSKSTLILKVRALFDLQDYEEALNTCNKLFELKPVSPVIVHIKGVLLMLLGQWEEAIKLINESILLDKTFIAWQEIKGICLSHIISESQEAINRM